MTPEEAIAEISDIYNNAVEYHDVLSDRAFGMAIEALGKQIPKKPIIRIDSGYYPYYESDWRYECPTCGNDDIDYPQHHCTCGQALDWSEEE